MDPFELLKHSEYNSIATLINSAMIHDYGIIVQDIGDGDVEVLSVQKRRGSVTRMQCKYLSSSSSLLSVSLKPMPGDLVLIVGLQNKKESFFTATEPIEVTKSPGYTVLNCVAIPLGVFNSEASAKVTVTDETVTLESLLPVTAIVNNLDVDVEEDFTLDAASVKINAGGKKAARIGDSVDLTLSATDIQSLAVALLTTGGFTPASAPAPASVPVTLNGGSITSGSDTVEIGD